MSRATVIADASYCQESNAGGWAFWVTHNPNGGGVIRIKKCGRATYENSTQAEIDAARRGVIAAYNAGARQILVQSDCQGVSVLVKEFALDNRYKGINVRYRHVPGHTNINDARSWVNRWCDRNAKACMRKVRDNVRTQVDLSLVEDLPQDA